MSNLIVRFPESPRLAAKKERFPGIFLPWDFSSSLSPLLIFPLPSLDFYTAHRPTPRFLLTPHHTAEAKKKGNSNKKRAPMSCAACHLPLVLLDCEEPRIKLGGMEARKSTTSGTSKPRSLAFLSSLHSLNTQCSPCQPYTASSLPSPCQLPPPTPTQGTLTSLSFISLLFLPTPQPSLNLPQTTLVRMLVKGISSL